jgi:hypothetical protein
MKTSESPICFTPSKTTTHQLDELSRITQMTPKAIIDDIVSFELASMFGSTDDSSGSLQRYLYRHDYSREQATKVAANYNAFVLRQAQRIGRPVTSAAVVAPDEHRFRIWFPLLTSRVQKIARQARQALQAAAA